ncbi:uncharacterized protein [Diadema antillarum]|uniref:uncharacterized protein n=1 Tax=Diadema antillarum TaxID=105358 RepID=UPI003A89F17C
MAAATIFSAFRTKKLSFSSWPWKASCNIRRSASSGSTGTATGDVLNVSMRTTALPRIVCSVDINHGNTRLMRCNDFAINPRLNENTFDGILCRRFSSSSILSRRMRGLNAEEESAIERKFSDPMNKYFDYEDVANNSLEEIARDQKRKLYSMQKSRMEREFRNAPRERTLSWDAIQQIRYLKQEEPEEWSVAMLAESFGVEEEVIRKVLKSRFMPKKAVRAKQDRAAAKNSEYLPSKTSAKVLALKASQDAVQSTESPAMQQIASRSESSTALQTKPSNVTSYTKYSSNADSPLPSTRTPRRQERKSMDISLPQKHSQKNENRHDQSQDSYQNSKHQRRQSYMTSKREMPSEAEAEFTFGKFDFENIDSLMGQVTLKPQIFQKGRNFYNEKGEFLYRI